MKDLQNRVLQRYLHEVEHATLKRYAARAPKVPFYTPATFKHIATTLADKLNGSYGISDWEATRFTKSKRKTISGVETYLEYKIFPKDKNAPVIADLVATMLDQRTRIVYGGHWAVQQSSKMLRDDHFETDDFAKLEAWMAALRSG